MLNLEELQLLAQLIDDIEIATTKMEKAYQDNSGEGFQNSKKAILDFQQKITRILDEGRK